MTLKEVVKKALLEDIGPGDWTTRLLVPAKMAGTAQVISKSRGVLSGLKAFREVYRQIDSSLQIRTDFADGSEISDGSVVLHLVGSVRAILSGERTALNFLQRLTGIASLTHCYVKAIKGSKAIILDTRKTTPMLRMLEKESVLHGGGFNHRFGLFDMILVKENHILAAGGVAKAIRRCQRNQKKVGIPSKLSVEVEIRSLDELDEAIQAGADRIMLDNFDLVDIREAARRVNGRVSLEVSGGIALANVREIASTGVDYISIGALTHSAPAHDFSLLVQP